MTTESRRRAQAEAALKEQGWEPITPGCWWEGELAVGRSVDGKYEASLWDDPDAKADTPWRCDVGVTPPDAEKEALWLLGIPRPEEVPALLMEHADILSVGYEGRRLDLATGTVFVDGRTRVAERYPTKTWGHRRHRLWDHGSRWIVPETVRDGSGATRGRWSCAGPLRRPPHGITLVTLVTLVTVKPV